MRRMRILTAAQMREVDRRTTERFAIPGLLLMENAAARSTEAIEATFGPQAGRFVRIVCGTGNNGGDGAAVARQLWTRGAIVDVLVLGRVDDTKGDARTNFDVVVALAGLCDRLGVREIETSDDIWSDTTEPDLYVDAIFGTGLSRPAEGIHAEAIELLNARGDCPLVALDLPSGLASDTPWPIGPHVRADLTVTFTAPKLACVLPPASEACGRLVTAAIGSPDDLLEESGARLSLVTSEAVDAWLAASRRTRDAHKGSVGSVLMLAGSLGKTGAAALAAHAAVRAGAGLVAVATSRSVQPALAAGAIAEVMTEPLDELPGGGLGPGALERVRELLKGRTVAAIGPGLGTADATRALVHDLVLARERPLVLDADALNCLAPWPEGIRGSAELPIVVTPHPAEMARIAGSQTDEVVRDRVVAARGFADRHGVIVVLKGAGTVVAEPNGITYVNPTGNAGMATGGSGDVLTGLVAGLLAQRPREPLEAAIAGVYLHGLAGDLAAAETGTRALAAGDLIAHLGRAFLAVGGDAERP